MNTKTTRPKMTLAEARLTDWGQMYGDRYQSRDVDYIARRMTGTLDAEGMIGEAMALSGMKRQIQGVVDRVCNGWKVGETQYGDGTSRYYIWHPDPK